ncbi:VWA domain-containing protein [Solirubrobacter ginsenosidimutans]|uniref:VWA domain-containing protein n=1 Tax=Solirubrobacter ginsenosidimutans TaxID=490573 RepID=A0A9X3MU74_9ACTN|nr:VWA domain-containing protein [Solirubrobacter ginsenosidimutans]MDA0162595.1 VWA domain-containing protein [Solirubrobacter ginsenosidimutans]
MTFQTPALLAVLLLPALALVAYLVFQRARRRFSVRFTNLDLLNSVVPNQAGWRRHVPPTLGLAAGILLVFAVARPETWVHVHRKGAQVMLVTDISGSMQSHDVSPDRLSAARAAADAFLSRLPKGARVGAVAFNDRATTLTGPTQDRDAVRRALAGLQSQGGTATGDGIDAALRSLGGKGGAIVLLSDGSASAGVDPLQAARRAAAAHVPVSTVALGTKGGVVKVTNKRGRERSIPVPPDPDALRKIARASGGRFVGAQDAESLVASYSRLGSTVGVERERRELTAAFAGAALLALSLGVGSSIAWFGRFP